METPAIGLPAACDDGCSQHRRDPAELLWRFPLRYQITTGVVVSTMVKQLAVGCDQWIMLYQNCAI